MLFLTFVLCCQRGDWKDLEFKEYNLNAQAQPIQIGYLQPLLEVWFKLSLHTLLRWLLFDCHDCVNEN